MGAAVAHSSRSLTMIEYPIDPPPALLPPWYLGGVPDGQSVARLPFLGGFTFPAWREEVESNDIIDPLY